MILIQSPQEATPLYFPQKRLLYIKVQIYKLFLMRRQQSYREAMQRRPKRMRQSIPDFYSVLSIFSLSLQRIMPYRQNCANSINIQIHHPNL